MVFTDLFFPLKTVNLRKNAYLCTHINPVFNLKHKNNMKASIFNRLTEAIYKLTHRENNYVDKQRQIIYLCYSLTMAIGTCSNILGITGSYDIFNTLTNSNLLLIILFLTFLYITKRIKLIQALTVLTIAVHITISVDNLYGALSPTLPNRILVILINMLILASNLFISLATYLTRVTQVNAIISLAIYIGCMVVTKDQTLKDYFLIILLIFISISLLGFQIAQNAKRLENENQILRRDEADLLHILRLNKAQIKAYIKLAKEEHHHDETRQLLDILGKTSQKNLIANVTEFMRHQDTERSKIDLAFPELSASEKEICQLILRNKKLGEICKTLNKTESNINTQRANIRKKLGLKPAENLQEMLTRRMNDVR